MPHKVKPETQDVNEGKSSKSKSNSFPEAGLVRLKQILGNPKADPPIPPFIPLSKSTWWLGVRSGRYPQPVKLGPRITAWRADDIRKLIGSDAAA
jgi:hypothetical protein